jgi:hypothetical protein
MGGSTPLPAEGFSYLRHFCYSPPTCSTKLSIRQRGGPGHFCPAPHVAMRVGLYLFRCRLQRALKSPCSGTPRTVSEDPAEFIRQFPADCPHRTDFHCLHRHPVTECDVGEYRRILGCSSKQWGFITAKLEPNRYSYGRRLPGLRFRASPEG